MWQLLQCDENCVYSKHYWLPVKVEQYTTIFQEKMKYGLQKWFHIYLWQVFYAFCK